MQKAAQEATTRRRVRARTASQLALSGLTFALLVAACSDDAIVYPNRNLRAAAGATVADAGEAGAPETGGAAQSGGGSGGKGGSSGSTVAGANSDDAGAAGTPVAGPECGNGTLEAPEECDDGNTISGDGCSADCQSSCEECEKYVCPPLDGETPPLNTASAYNDCYQAAGKIKQGPATGVKRAEVCGELVDCIREEQCSQSIGFRVRSERCWCDLDWTDGTLHQISTCQDPATFVPGKCASLFQDASEGSKPTDVSGGLTALEHAEGAALRLVQHCDTRVCTEECLPGYLGHGVAATITADIIAAHNAAGESPLCDLLADAQRTAAQVDIALVPFDALASVEVPSLSFTKTPHRAADADGRVLWSEARAATLGYAIDSILGIPTSQPYDSSIVKVTLTGKQLYDTLAQTLKGTSVDPNRLPCVSGLSFTWDSSQPDGSRLIEVRKAGVALDMSAQYVVALGSRLVDPVGPISVLAGIKGTTAVPGAEPSEILGQYLSKLPQPVAPPELNRITRLP